MDYFKENQSYRIRWNASASAAKSSKSGKVKVANFSSEVATLPMQGDFILRVWSSLCDTWRVDCLARAVLKTSSENHACH